MNIPKYKKKLARHIRMKLISRSGPKYWLNLNGFAVCCKCDEIVKFVMTSRPRMRKAQISHRPAETDFGKQVHDHDWEDDPS